jgi:hypothetical protein
LTVGVTVTIAPLCLMEGVVGGTAAVLATRSRPKPDVSPGDTTGRTTAGWEGSRIVVAPP